MIDRTLLTEALAYEDGELIDRPDVADTWDVISDAARLLLDFPTDEQVEAAAPFITGDDPRMVLEAVRDTMIGDNQ